MKKTTAPKQLPKKNRYTLSPNELKAISGGKAGTADGPGLPYTPGMNG
jgi:hypothetical protein